MKYVIITSVEINKSQFARDSMDTLFIEGLKENKSEMTNDGLKGK